MATTTNYSWTTPDDTALVKDGASAIRSLGTAIDTTTKNLNPSTTLGDIEYRSSSANTNTRLGIGSTGQVLTVSGGVPAWSTISAGGMTLISETVASANSSISLSSIPQTYKQLLLTWGGIQHSATGSIFALRANNSSSFINRTMGIKSYSGALSSDFDNVDHIGTTDIYAFGQNTTGANQFSSKGWLIIDNYVSTTKYKPMTVNFGYYNNTTANTWVLNSTGFLETTSAISSLDIVRISGSGTISNQANTSIRLYGLS